MSLDLPEPESEKRQTQSVTLIIMILLKNWTITINQSINLMDSFHNFKSVNLENILILFSLFISKNYLKHSGVSPTISANLWRK